MVSDCRWLTLRGTAHARCYEAAGESSTTKRPSFPGKVLQVRVAVLQAAEETKTLPAFFRVFHRQPSTCGLHVFGHFVCQTLMEILVRGVHLPAEI